ncbi:sec-independent protein translocase protein TatA [Rubritalea squalenifaciens DSM 18772]|uniref:Sec-independent protein translocase protein TatA n=2 Tax=Rubritalea TaxID=361050 RepID=A0A1M6PAY4_9BACT|nr:twin-arginine translocase TatA/TatE family subunit [Rubritalea squalenifaciens]SHK05129.1 sec-independent protein translocase protein TatA [Rubritalea squalenifaciens DSM 18772]
MNTYLLFLGSFGGQEMMIVFLIVLLLFGAKKLPQLARGIGKSMGEFKRARDEFEQEITRSEDEVSAKKPAKTEEASKDA